MINGLTSDKSTVGTLVQLDCFEVFHQLGIIVSLPHFFFFLLRNLKVLSHICREIGDGSQSTSETFILSCASPLSSFEQGVESFWGFESFTDWRWAICRWHTYWVFICKLTSKYRGSFLNRSCILVWRQLRCQYYQVMFLMQIEKLGLVMMN